jgi:hypothetical protein
LKRDERDWLIDALVFAVDQLTDFVHGFKNGRIKPRAFGNTGQRNN